VLLHLCTACCLVPPARTNDAKIIFEDLSRERVARAFRSAPTMASPGIAPGCPQCRPRKSLSYRERQKNPISARLGDQAALSKMFFILVLIGAVISVVSFCAIPVRCRVCSASASICLRACSVDNSTNADGVFTPST
jgi:hypothetical protein